MARPRKRATTLNPNEFGPLESTRHLYRQKAVKPQRDLSEELVPYYVVLTTYLLYLCLMISGHLRDFWDRRFDRQYRRNFTERDGYAPLLTDFDSFYTRRLKARIHDCFAVPTTGVPGRLIRVFTRNFKRDEFFVLDQTPVEMLDCVNLSSYNYLGFAQSVGQCTDETVRTISERGLVAGGNRFGTGNMDLHLEVERVVANFIGKESAMIWSMGYATNAVVFRTLVDRRCLVLSDELNHASIRTGLRISGAVIKVYPHNDMEALESLIREQIAQGQPRSRRPWRKILIAFEGLYSMEGTMCNLPSLVRLREKYGCYLFMDEAHSIGAMGPEGRGICNYFNIDTSNVDVLMGTFTKSFGSVGGYVGGSQKLIDRLKFSNMGNVYAEAPTPPALAQIRAAILTLTGELRPGEGAERLQRLAFNSRYLRLGFRKMGFVVSGHIDSPVIPVMLYHPTKMALFSRLLRQDKIASVIVGYPATAVISSRIRFCMSAALTKSDLDYVLEKMDELGDLLRVKVARKIPAYSIEKRPFREFRDELPAETLSELKF